MSRRALLLAVLAACLGAAAPAAGAADGRWLAGDLHVHTCFSHDVVCGVPGQEDLEQLYAVGLDVAARFQEAALRGLDYLAITDHNDVSSTRAPGFGSHGVLGIPGYEDSIHGHAQVLGETRLLDNGDASAAAISRLVDELHADGGVFQANHPGYTIASPFSDCAGTEGLHWGYGYEVRPDTIEVWNPTAPVLDAERYLECWLARGARIGVTGGSDSHWVTTAAIQGVGNPTTWVLARHRTPAAVLAALRAGRTSVSRLPPAQGGAPLLLQVRGAHGAWRNAIGTEVAPGAPMRVVSRSALAAGLVTVRANGGPLLVADAPLPPGGAVEFAAPPGGWMRALLHPLGSAAQGVPECAHESGQSSPVSLCAYDHTLLALTSPAYVAAG